MSPVNFITEHWRKSSLFPLNIEKFTLAISFFRTYVSSAQTGLRFTSSRFRGVAPAESHKKLLMCKHNRASICMSQVHKLDYASLHLVLGASPLCRKP